MIFKLTRSFTFTMVSCSDQSVWKCWRKNNEYDLRFVLNEEGGGGRCEAKPGVKESEGLSVWYQNVGNISASCNKHFTNNCNMNIISYTPMHEHYIGDPWTLLSRAAAGQLGLKRLSQKNVHMRCVKISDKRMTKKWWKSNII